LYFFFQAEDGIRDRNVTGVQTCALPIFVLIVLNPLLAWSRTLATIGFDADALVAFAFPSTFVNAFDALSVALIDIGLDTAFLTVPAFAFTLSNVFPVLLIAVIGIFLLAFVLALEALATTA